ncbi:MAG: hypothetical protein N3H31_06200, partial [Candidatus Nezhaarchaeota archaeon]|nr:hypothetical protein [Candidatus Nezhaarchaeota archaeon]
MGSPLLPRRNFLKLASLTTATITLRASFTEPSYGLSSRGDYYSILFDNTKCIGCNSCVVACRLWNGSQGFSERPVRVTAGGEVLETIGPVLLKGKVGPTDPPRLPRLDVYHLVVIEPRPELKDSKGRPVFQRRSCMHCVE